MAAAGDPDSLAVGDPGGHVHRDLGPLDLAAAALAGPARLGGHATVAVADVARGGAHDLPEGGPRDGPELAGAAAPLAGLDRGARLGAVAVTVLAARDHLIGDLDARAGGRLGKVDRGVDRHVASLDRAGGRRAAAAERAAAEEGLEDVRHRAEGLEVRRVATGAQALVAVAVVGRAAFGVGEHLIGLGRLLELLLGARVVAVDVGMQLPRQPPEGLLDLAVVGGPGDAEDVVVVTWHGRAHRSSYTSAMNVDSYAAASRTERMAWP